MTGWEGVAGEAAGEASENLMQSEIRLRRSFNVLPFDDGCSVLLAKPGPSHPDAPSPAWDPGHGDTQVMLTTLLLSLQRG